MKPTRVIHPKLDLIAAMVEGLARLSQEIARETARRMRVPRRRGGTLRPGPDTPCWNALRAAVIPHLKRRGSRALLAHYLGVAPGRVHEFFTKNAAMPDAERTLVLIQWLASVQAGRRPG